MANVRQIDEHLRQMLHLAAALLDELLDVLHDLVSLLGSVVAVLIFRCIEVLRTLASEEDHRTACDDDLAEVIVELLFPGTNGDTVKSVHSAKNFMVFVMGVSVDF
jgi:hypothetical protein